MAKNAASVYGTDLRQRRGQKVVIEVPVATMAAGSPLTIAIHAVVGTKPGPVLGLIGGQHGNEIGSVVGPMKALEAIEPAQVSGTVLAVPVANPISFEQGVRSTWADAMYGGTTGNLNRVWPGNPNGFLTERIASVISEHVLAKADFVLDFHATTKGSIAIYYGYVIEGDDEVSRRASELGLAFGMEIMVRGTATDAGASGVKLLDYMNRQLGLPCTAVEVGEFYGFDGGSEPLRKPIEVSVTGVTNVMKAMGMLEGEPTLPSRQLIISPEQRCQPAQGGVLFPSVSRRHIGSTFEQGTTLGTVRSPYTFEKLDEIKAPFAQSVLLSALDSEGFSKVNPGDQAFHCGDLSRASWVTNR